MVMLSAFPSDSQVLTRQRPAYQKLARAIRPIAAVAMPNPGQASRDVPRVNEKQDVWLEQSYRWWTCYRSVNRALGLLSRLYSSWSAVAS